MYSNLFHVNINWRISKTASNFIFLLLQYVFPRLVFTVNLVKQVANFGSRELIS